ncbi:hypothetical protein QTQ03_22740 [Micromonospora sp. WMMA1363]|uniref:LppM family (lipo)protein n=1 Tax=Micromonospora sp. WMMA1363 TaxID=3053985 RepID=UPI00259D0E15|nr:hypothetical protein [Micromonospora sp. WMMA1363]MDM4722267.1 hypothetical protein [Micromonospora sp. WMMA1363]
MIARTAICLALVAALSGCGAHLRMGLDAREDETVDGQLLLYFDDSYLSQYDIRRSLPPREAQSLPAGSVELIELAKAVENYPRPPAGTLFSRPGFRGTQVKYSNTPVAGIWPDALTLKRDGNEYKFSFPLSSSESHSKSLTALSIEISLTFPGRVIETNGTVNGNSVTWQYAADDAKPSALTAVACASAAAAACPKAADTGTESSGWGWGWWALVIAGAVILLAAVALAGLRLFRRRGQQTGPTPGSGGPPATSPPTKPTSTSEG